MEFNGFLWSFCPGGGPAALFPDVNPCAQDVVCPEGLEGEIKDNCVSDA